MEFSILVHPYRGGGGGGRIIWLFGPALEWDVYVKQHCNPLPPLLGGPKKQKQTHRLYSLAWRIAHNVNWDRVNQWDFPDWGLKELGGVQHAEMIRELGGKSLGAFSYDFSYMAKRLRYIGLWTKAIVKWLIVGSKRQKTLDDSHDLDRRTH